MSNENDLTGGSDTLPSRLYLPKLQCPPATIFEHLLGNFPHVPPGTWRARVSRGLVTLSDGTTLREDSPYRHGLTVFYRREVPSEPAPVEEAQIIYRDEEILVADKPHGMPVTPAGEYLERSLLVGLQRSTGLATLAAMHRLDRDTGGLLLLTIKPAARGCYHRLFADALIEREYLAVAHITDAPNRNHWRVENRMESGEPWYRQRIVDGPANAITEIELLDVRGSAGLFRLVPKSGKKHQLRVHMVSIGFPIIGDPFYPNIREKREGDPPLQLLANRLAFIDPLSGVPRSFTSVRRLWF
ncbi:MAG TPA: pseudouridine synthase [Terriglobia bacterium]|nr:pseudouridine synthase [Terriglobia bacterium]